MTEFVLLSSNLGMWIPLTAVLSIALGSVVGFFVRVKIHEKSLAKSREEAAQIIENAKNESEKIKEQKIEETKTETTRLTSEYNAYVSERKRELQSQQAKLENRENALDQRSISLDKRQENLDRKEQSIDDRKAALEQKHTKLDATIEEQEAKLLAISKLTQEEASKIIMERTEAMMEEEIAEYIHEEEEKAKDEAKAKAEEIITLAIQKYASDVTSEHTISVVSIPNDDMKGRIIGREGRNIRAFESLTGVDLIVDDTPETIILSCFDPIRREIARRALEFLIEDGRIHPAKIEEMVEKAKAEVNNYIRDCGNKAIFEVGVGKMHPDFVKVLGRLQFRTSYGQNVLDHSKEVAFFAGKMAAELGEDEILAKRAGLLHDIGKAIDHEVEGSHVELGVQLAKRYKEHPVVVNAIASHHGDAPQDNLISVIVQAADAMSAARLGARSETLENYINRLETLENIANNVKGVDESFAIQAGREIRIAVKPDQVSDAELSVIALDVKKQIEENLTYPGTIKVTVIREKRVQEIAK